MSSKHDLRGIRLLVVDDDPDIRDVYQFLLDTNGATVTAAESGNSAWKRFREEPPDLVIRTSTCATATATS